MVLRGPPAMERANCRAMHPLPLWMLVSLLPRGRNGEQGRVFDRSQYLGQNLGSDSRHFHDRCGASNGFHQLSSWVEVSDLQVRFPPPPGRHTRDEAWHIVAPINTLNSQSLDTHTRSSANLPTFSRLRFALSDGKRHGLAARGVTLGS